MANWTKLREALSHGEVLLPGDEGYRAGLERWSVTCEVEAAVVVKPTCADEVSACVKFAVASRLPLTVCCGGHSTSGLSSTEGMVIHMGNMRRVDVDEADLTVTFEGGCLWSDVEARLEAHGLATVAGVVNHTGVGGLLLGGGHGWLTPKHGLAIDNLVEVQMVLADGSVVEASDTRNADLFWAARGAGALLGVATRFVSRAHRQGAVWSGIMVFAPDKLSQLVAVANELHLRDGREGHCLALGVGYQPDGKTRMVSAVPLFHGSEDEARQYFAGLLQVEAVRRQTRMMSMAQVNSLFNPVFEHGLRRLISGANVRMPLDAAGLQETADMLWSFCDGRAGTGASLLVLEVFPTHKIGEVRQDATAYANRGEHYDMAALLAWTDAALDGEVRDFSRRWRQQVGRTNGLGARHGTGTQGNPVGRYLNMEPDPVRAEEAYGGNLERLRELKRRYDPGNVFHSWFGTQD